METVYIETTIPGYLAAHSSRQTVMAQHQKFTHEWWNMERSRYRLFTSFLVRTEASRGDAGAVARRMPYLDKIPDLDVPLEADALSKNLIKLLKIPQKAEADATHLALTILHRITSAHLELHSPRQPSSSEGTDRVLPISSTSRPRYLHT